MKYPTGVATP